MLESVTLLGSSSGRNAGDAALMAAIMDGVDRRVGGPLLYEIPTIRPAYVSGHYPRNRVRPVGMMPWELSVKMLGVPTLRSILRTDLSLIFDAILFDRALYNPLFNFLSTLRLFLPHAARRGKRIACFNVGVGPVRTAAGREMLRTIAELMTFITVRDQESLDILRDIGVQNPRILLTADAALSAPSADEARADAILRTAGMEPNEPILGVNINRYLDSWVATGRPALDKASFLDIYATALRRVLGELKVPVLFVATQHEDVTLTSELMSRMPAGQRVGLLTNVDYDHFEMKGALRKLSLLCGMRLHSMILASAELTPIVGLIYQPKVGYYFNLLGLQERALPFEAFNADALANLILGGWRNRAAIRGQLSRTVPRLQREADKAAELVAAMHRGEDVDAAIKRLA